MDRQGRAIILGFLAAIVWGVPPAPSAFGATWSAVSVPSPISAECDLKAIAVTAAGQAWAVGTYQTSSGENRSLVLRFSSGNWSVVPSPNPAGSCTDGNVMWGGNGLSGVSGSSPNDIWAVGAGCYGSETLIERWEGSSWSLVASPNPFPDGQNVLTSVVAISPTDAWAVGYTGEAIGVGTLVEHWDGTRWSVVASPRIGTGGDLFGVAAVSASDVWAVGAYYDEQDGRWETLIVHWDGAAWSVVPSPSPGTYRSFLHGIAALSANDVWAVGEFSSGAGDRTLVEHWNGVRWDVVPSPNVATGYSTSNVLRSIAALSSTEIWAAGMFHNVNTDVHQHRPLLAYWNGSQWSIASAPHPGKSSELNAIAANASGKAWCVGLFSEYLIDIYDGHYTLAQSLVLEGTLDPVLAVEPADVRAGALLGAPWPNPASSTVSLAVRLPKAAEVELAIYDPRGRRLRSLLTEKAEAGDHVVSWDGKDARGARCSPGVYFARLEVNGREVGTRRLTLLH